MQKKFLLLLTLCLIASTTCAVAVPLNYDLYKDIHRNKQQGVSTSGNVTSNSKNTNENKYYSDDIVAEWESAKSVYPNATINSAIRKYKSQNYSGCLQEMISLSKKDKSNPVIYYYMAMSYAQLGNKEQALKAYETVLKLNPDAILTQYATQGRDCLVGGPSCNAVSNTDFDNFVRSGSQNGISNNLNKQLKEQQLRNIQKTINNKQDLNGDDIERIQKFDNKSENTPTNEDVLAAIETLKKAGVTISINPYQQNMPVDDQYAQVSMLLGNNNNNNNNMMNMLPYLMAQSENGQKIDPQIFQTMMMNNLITDFSFNDDKKY